MTNPTSIAESSRSAQPRLLGASERRKRIVAVGVIATAACLLDLGTKRWVFDWLGTPPAHRIHWVWEGYFGLETSVNTGALAGIGSGHTSILAVVSVVASIGILIWVMTGGAIADWTITIATGLILGGVWGNLYDRLGLWGVQGVRDWIRWQYGDFVWPNFNLADSFLVCGSALLLLHAFRNPGPAESTKSAQSPKSS